MRRKSCSSSYRVANFRFLRMVSFGMLLTVMAIQSMSLGDTPLGHFNRSLPVIIVGMMFAGLGAFSLDHGWDAHRSAPDLPWSPQSICRNSLDCEQLSIKGLQGSITLPRDITRLGIVQTCVAFITVLFGLSMLLPAFYPTLLSGPLPSFLTAGILV